MGMTFDTYKCLHKNIGNNICTTCTCISLSGLFCLLIWYEWMRKQETCRKYCWKYLEKNKTWDLIWLIKTHRLIDKVSEPLAAATELCWSQEGFKYYTPYKHSFLQRIACQHKLLINVSVMWHCVKRKFKSFLIANTAKIRLYYLKSRWVASFVGKDKQLTHISGITNRLLPNT